MIEDEIQVWRTLKALTTGDAKKTILSVKNEDGFRAWQKLHQRYEQCLAAGQGAVLAEFTGMITKPSKTPAETRKIVTEIEQKMKRVEDATGTEVDQNHAKSILIGVLDPITKQHTAMKHGQETSFEELKKLVLEFAGNVADSQESMQLGSFMKNEFDNGENNFNTNVDKDLEEEWEHNLGAFGKGGMSCYTCGGVGHMSRECPSKGKGKGKGKDKGGFGKNQYGFGKGSGPAFGGFKGEAKGKGKSGKGESKGPALGCWTCGGAHFQSNCPKGRGKGGGSMRSFEETYNEWGQEVRSLCCLSTHIEKAFEDKAEWKVIGKPTQGQTKILKNKAKESRCETSVKKGRFEIQINEIILKMEMEEI